MGPERLPNRLDMIGAPLRGACAACSKYSEKLNMVKILGSNTYLWHLVGYRSISKLIKCTVLATNLRERERERSPSEVQQLRLHFWSAVWFLCAR